MNELPCVVDTDADIDGVDIVDENGYVVLRLSGGDIETENFDSSEVKEDILGLQNGISSVRSDMSELPSVVDTDATTDGIDLVDEDGYVVMRLADGHI